MNQKYYLEDASEVLEQFDTTENGLSSAEAQKRLDTNEIGRASCRERV